MPTVTIEPNPDTPSQGVIKAANQVQVVTDSTGRKIGLRRPDFLAEFRLVEDMGPALAANTTYMAMLMPLLFVAEIDGQPVDAPTSKITGEALIQRLGRAGYAAVAQAMETRFADDAAEARIKNSPGTPASATASGS